MSKLQKKKRIEDVPKPVYGGCRLVATSWSGRVTVLYLRRDAKSTLHKGSRRLGHDYPAQNKELQEYFGPDV